MSSKDGATFAEGLGVDLGGNNTYQGTVTVIIDIKVSHLNKNKSKMIYYIFSLSLFSAKFNILNETIEKIMGSVLFTCRITNVIHMHGKLNTMIKYV